MSDRNLPGAAYQNHLFVFIICIFTIQICNSRYCIFIQTSCFLCCNGCCQPRMIITESIWLTQDIDNRVITQVYVQPTSHLNFADEHFLRPLPSVLNHSPLHEFHLTKSSCPLSHSCTSGSGSNILFVRPLIFYLPIYWKEILDPILKLMLYTQAANLPELTDHHSPL